jgi:predicted nicotinamide N-methyase
MRKPAALRLRMERLFPLRDLDLALPGTDKRYTITLPANPNEPLDRFAAVLGARTMEQARALADRQAAATHAADQARAAIASGERMPYWALAWPSGQALAAALLASPEAARGRRTLELGCGLGVTAAAALDAGAALWAADCFPEALLFCGYNSLRASGRMPHSLLLDWRSPAGRDTCQALAPFDLLLAADVLYERDDLDPLLSLVPQLLSPTGAFWLAEPGRSVARTFVATLQERGWHDKETIYERSWPPFGDTARVAVHRLTPPAPPLAPPATAATSGASRAAERTASAKA